MINEIKITEYKDREIVVEDLNCWFLEHGVTTNTKCSKKTVLVLRRITFLEYDLFKKRYPLIYLGNALVSKYNSEIEGYVFMPTVEFATEEKCYITNLKDEDFVDVIIDSFEYETIIDDEYEYNSNENKLKTFTDKKAIRYKTYLMRDGNGYTKIGKSFSPVARESTLQSENPTIELIAVCKEDIESILHKEYKIKRKRGEWFDLSNIEVSFIIKNYKFIKHDTNEK